MASKSLHLSLVMVLDTGNVRVPVNLYSASSAPCLVPVWRELGVYSSLYELPGASGVPASELVLPLEEGMAELVMHAEKYEAMLSSTEVSYSAVVRYLSKLLSACKKYPKATVTVGTSTAYQSLDYVDWGGW